MQGLAYFGECAVSGQIKLDPVWAAHVVIQGQLTSDQRMADVQI